ncbi:hypothetical protein [Massilia sp. TWR1-2-2]|uniref:hypothetical protein n=1 Tax=Massilia sp. TWR1-2-2 TaxID=2804584 RepID=UPI003CF169FB
MGLSNWWRDKCSDFSLYPKDESYILMAMCVTWALSDVGITSNLSGAPKPVLDPLAIRYLSFMLVWLAGSVVILFLTRHLYRKYSQQPATSDHSLGAKMLSVVGTALPQ